MSISTAIPTAFIRCSPFAEAEITTSALKSGESQVKHLTVRLAENEQEIISAKRLRYDVFYREMGAKSQFATNNSQIDEDDFDEYCDHLIAIDNHQNKIVGTYRILPPEQRKNSGKWYAQGEFDMQALLSIADKTVELGRSCVHADYRNGAIIALLWSGLAQYMQAGNYQFLTGCASIPLIYGDEYANEVISRTAKYLSPPQYRVEPYNVWQSSILEKNQQNINSTSSEALPPLPALLKGYLRAGAWICSKQAAYDADFNTADLLILLPMENVSPRHSRHFLHRP